MSRGRGARRRERRRSHKRQQVAAVSDERVIALARDLPAEEASAWIVSVTGGQLVAIAARSLKERGGSTAHRFAFEVCCEVLRPFVDAGVLDRGDAARAAHSAVRRADTGHVYRAAKRAGRLNRPEATS